MKPAKMGYNNWLFIGQYHLIQNLRTNLWHLYVYFSQADKCKCKSFVLQREKTYLQTCVPNKDAKCLHVDNKVSDRTAQMSSLVRVCCSHGDILHPWLSKCTREDTDQTAQILAGFTFEGMFSDVAELALVLFPSHSRDHRMCLL